MATMFPSEVEHFTTRGEEEVYIFLRDAARPDGMFLAWYSPDIQDREPDFILYSPDCGLIVLEVKDWIITQILEADPKTATLQIGNHQETRKQPLAQAREYASNLLNMLQKAQNYRRQIPCPITWGAVFPHISRSDFNASGLAKVMDAQKVLCWDDLSENSPLLRDKSGAALRSWLAEHFPPLFQFQLSNENLNWIRGLIFPVVRIELPKRSGISQQDLTIMALDQEQENMARQFGKGKLLLTGPAGCAKTLVLVHQAWNLPKVDNNIRHILVTCFNLSLVGYIRRLLISKGIGLGPDGVEVIPFYGLCERILGEKLAHSREHSDYYQLIVRETLERLEGDHPLKAHWDAILVDEGQDFSHDMAEIILKLLPEHGSLTIAEDENQRIYNDDKGWRDWNIPGLTIKRLKRQYRNTRKIAEFAAKVLAAPVDTSENTLSPGSGISGEIEYAGAYGEDPVWLQIADQADLINAVAEAVAKLARTTSMSEIAILYAGKRGNLPHLLMQALEARGVLSRWSSQNEATKRSYDITTDSVTISTIYSVKGMDYAHVFLFGLDRLSVNEKNRRLAYVGMTRARETLTLCVNENAGIASLLS